MGGIGWYRGSGWGWGMGPIHMSREGIGHRVPLHPLHGPGWPEGGMGEVEVRVEYVRG